MSTSTPNITELSRDELEQLVNSLRGQVAAGQGPNPDAGNEEHRPWNVAAQNAEDVHTRREAPLPYRGEGAVLHHWPHLTGGSGGPQDGPYVRALAELLAELGYDSNDVIRGRVGYFENTLAGDVARFKRDNDVMEQTQAYHGHNEPAEDVVKRLVGPYTVQALFEKVAAKREQPVASVIGQVEYEIGKAHGLGRVSR
jgi:hypothetical protein